MLIPTILLQLAMLLPTGPHEFIVVGFPDYPEGWNDYTIIRVTPEFLAIGTTVGQWTDREGNHKQKVMPDCVYHLKVQSIPMDKNVVFLKKYADGTYQQFNVAKTEKVDGGWEVWLC